MNKNTPEPDTQLQNLNIKTKSQAIERNVSRVICRLLMYGSDPERIKSIVKRISSLDEEMVAATLNKVVDDFSDRHKNIRSIFRYHYRQVYSYIPPELRESFSKDQKLLIGAYFTMEYAIESAALFNPSIVPHPDQSTAKKNGKLHFIMSLRAVGEGHISSIVFRSGMINAEGELTFEPSSPFVKTPEIENPVYRKNLFRMKLEEMRACNKIARYILDQLPEKFIYDELKEQIKNLSDNPKFNHNRQLLCFKNMRQLADSDYQLKFEDDHHFSERVIFPVSEEESGGIEDARFVRFEEDPDNPVYYATYTAYDGRNIMPQLIETHDFNVFKINPLYGDAVKNKGMALFPRKVGGRYAMLSRQDGENNRIMFSDRLRHWNESEIIQSPKESWEMIQLGNCGSPLELPEGWLVLTHGVGPMRTYSIGAILLDLEDPTKMIGRLDRPLLTPNRDDVIGYVPNVVYTCGSIIHNGYLVIPYAISDFEPAVASVKVDELLNAMKQY